MRVIRDHAHRQTDPAYFVLREVYVEVLDTCQFRQVSIKARLAVRLSEEQGTSADVEAGVSLVSAAEVDAVIAALQAERDRVWPTATPADVTEAYAEPPAAVGSGVDVEA